MATTIRPPQWTQGEGPRILVEACEWAERAHLAQLLGAAGYRTATCPGPEGADRKCPLSAGSGCPAVERADAVVHLLRHSDPRNRHVLISLRERHPELPVVVYAPEPTVEANPDDFAGTIVIHPPLSDEAILNALSTALAGT
jgi:hypothetical protein